MARQSYRVPALLLLLLLATTIAACGGGQAPASSPSGEPVTGDAARGEELFKQATIGAASAPGCSTCHTLDAGVTLVGPSLAGVAGRAAEVGEGTVEEYLEQSIREPNAHVAEGFSAGVMYQNYARDLTAQQIADLVAFLATLE